jgi:S-DNA-T family DNA segregation ATPase FtsK/SpoIIIE
MTDWSQGARAPWLPAPLAAFLQRRGAELAGLALMALGAALAGALLSYDARDPGWFVATSEPARNWLGESGALMADPLVRSLGLAAAFVAALPLVWGVRMLLHRGSERIWSRMTLGALAAPLLAMFASAHAPYDAWPFEAPGLGGFLGDMGLEALLRATPGSASDALPFATLGLALVAAPMAALGMGVDREEAGFALRWFRAGLRTATAVAVALVAAAVGAARARLNGPRSQRVAPPEPVGRSRRREPVLRAAPDAAEVEPDDDFAPPPVVAPRVAPAPVAPPRSLRKSRRAERDEQPRLNFDGERPEGYDAPPLTLLQAPKPGAAAPLSAEALDENARMLESVLDDYGVRGEITAVRPGPVVTLYELEPAPGTKASRVIGLSDDIARSMCAIATRVSTVPGRNVIGVELPNAAREKVVLREILSSPVYEDAGYRLALALGKDIAGEPVVANLARMPHLLIAGTTGSGKSVAINTMILSLLYRLGPEECRLIMIDPKMLELSVYDGIPHLLSPVVTDPKKAVVALKWTVAEMEDRYRKMSKLGVRNIDGYNARVGEALANDEPFTRTVQTGFDEATGEPIFETEEFSPEKLPYIVVIVDEMADLMMVAGKEIEACVQRLAQMARASGIHIIMATQRPSVDVITGTIKANFPTRISFQVTSKIDSRTILGEQGAEQLLGQGDMLYMSGGGRVTRVHGPFVSDEEVEEVVRHLKTLGAPDYVAAVTEGGDDETMGSVDEVLGLGGELSEEQLYDRAVAIVARDRKCSTSYIQRKLQIGYNRAARLVEEMEAQGVVTPANHVGKREILVGQVE